LGRARDGPQPLWGFRGKDYIYPEQFLYGMKLFRRVRQKLLSQNKYKKYLSYAVGEIILVVIGILIALTINNCQNRKILKQKEQTYLTGLKEEFETNKIKLNNLILVNKENYSGVKKILDYTGKTTFTLSEKEFSTIMINSFSYDIFYNPSNSLLNEMISSGSLKDISNQKLRAMLTNWISTLEDVSRQEKDLDKQRGFVLDVLRSKDKNLRKMLEYADKNKIYDLSESEKDVSNLSLLNSNAFENNLLLFYLTSLGTEASHYLPLMETIDEILLTIDAEIK
jgi:hypothetical protein